MYVFYDVAQFSFKIAAGKNILEKTDLQVIKVPVNEVRSAGNDKEIWVGGKLYDVSGYVIVDDTAIVSVFHDEDEEGIVKSIVSCFEPNEKCCTDNIVHVSKRHVHAPNDNKILVEPFTVSYCVGAVSYHSLSFFKDYFSLFSTSVIKPPPKVY